MKVLHLLKTEPDETTRRLVSMLENLNACESTVVRLDDWADYEELIDIIFEHDTVISWW